VLTCYPAAYLVNLHDEEYKLELEPDSLDSLKSEISSALKLGNVAMVVKYHDSDFNDWIDFRKLTGPALSLHLKLCVIALFSVARAVGSGFRLARRRTNQVDDLFER
jgi:hypothetical protein